MTTNLTRRLLVAAACIAALAAAAPAFAQTQGPGGVQEGPKETSASTVKMVVLADVNVTDATSTLKGNTVSGSFALQGKMGQQNDILYGIIVVDAKGNFVDVRKLGEVANVRQGELRPISFSYTVPAYVKGQAKILIMAETSGGLMLGSQSLAGRDWKGSGPSTSCSVTATTTVACITTVDTALRITGSPTLFGAQTTIQDSVQAKKNQQVKIDFSGAPAGTRFITVMTAQGETHVLPVSASGTYASLQSVVVARDASGQTMLRVAFRSSETRGTSLAYELKDGAGAVCDSGSHINDGFAAAVAIKNSCTEGTITVQLLGSKGNVLAVATEPFSVLELSSATAPKGQSTVLVLLVTLIALGVLIYAVRQWRQKSTVPPAIIGIMVLVAFFSFGNRAAAISFTISAWETGIGEPAWICDGSADTDKSTYEPGETLTINVSFGLTKEVGPSATGKCSVGYNSQYLSGYSDPIWDESGPFGSTYVIGPIGSATSGSNFFSGSRQFTAPASNGTHFLALRPLVEALSAAGVQTAADWIYANETFSVSSTPTVKVWFGP